MRLNPTFAIASATSTAESDSSVLFISNNLWAKQEMGIFWTDSWRN
jgi:hypothetical protein